MILNAATKLAQVQNCAIKYLESQESLATALARLTFWRFYQVPGTQLPVFVESE